MPGRSSRPRRLLYLLAAGLVLVLSACGDKIPQDTLDPAGPNARTIDRLQNPMFIAAGIVFLLVEGLIVYIVIRFRQRKGREDDVPRQLHGNTVVEIMWTIAPAVVLACFALPTVVTLFDLSEEPKDAVQVSVTGQQWWWEFRYPPQDGVDQEIITANEIVIPAGKPVYLTMTSRDVIHSFWVPKLNGKKDVVPGRTHHWTIEADADTPSGTILEGQCVEYCGLSHANMRLRAKVLSPDDFQQWLTDQQQDAPEPTTELATTGRDQFKQLCTSCHQINGVNEQPKAAQKSGAAPNLTHLASRSRFAGALFDVNRNNLEAWLRNPPAMKPMLPDDNRGMPNLNLSEEQIDSLVSYLLTLK